MRLTLDGNFNGRRVEDMHGGSCVVARARIMSTFGRLRETLVTTRSRFNAQSCAAPTGLETEL